MYAFAHMHLYVHVYMQVNVYFVRLFKPVWWLAPGPKAVDTLLGSCDYKPHPYQVPLHHAPSPPPPHPAVSGDQALLAWDQQDH